MELSFGSGLLWGARTDAVIGSTPDDGARMFGVLQDVAIDFDFTNKPLWGQYQFPVAIARGQGKISGKAKFAQILALTYRDLFWGLSSAAGQFAVSFNEAQSVPGSSTYTITVTNSATYNDDLGVIYASTGKRFTRVSSVAAAGQYSVNFSTGVYTFYSGDASAAVEISYTYLPVTGGTKITITNQLLGTTPTFAMRASGPSSTRARRRCVPAPTASRSTRASTFARATASS